MYTHKNITYASPGSVLRDLASGTVALQFPAGTELIEIQTPIDHMRIVGSYAVWGGGLMLQEVKSEYDYSYYKAQLIKRRYSNDDQIAIMLNDEEFEMQKMQEWREWAAAAAKKIVELQNA